MPSVDRSGPSTFDAYVDALGGWRSSKPREGIGPNVCESCGSTADRFLDDQCESCARWHHGFDQGERDATEALLATLLAALIGRPVYAAHELPGDVVWSALRGVLATEA